MALTIEQIQSNITEKRDVREILNQLADYIQANPSGGGSSVESVTAGDASIIIGGTATDPTIRQGLKYAMIFVTQAAQNVPTAQIPINTTGLTFTYQRDSEGEYRIIFSAPVDVTKVMVSAQFYEDNGDGDAGQVTITGVLANFIGWITTTGNHIDGNPAEQEGTVMFLITIVD